tara:strand:- start:1563 stop:2273 length:711 start_codon:yes stop_codon:yes gene_type:complete
MRNINRDRILVIAAHPDDEILGLGGTLNYLKKLENSIKVVIMSKGIASRYELNDKKNISKEIQSHLNCIEESKKIIGYDDLVVHDLPDNKFDSIPILDVIKIVEKEIESYKPDVIFTHHGGDLNIDHRIVFQSVITATRPVNVNCENLKYIFSFQTPSSTEWQVSYNKSFFPNYFFHLDLENINAKVNAMDKYTFEKREYPHPRSKEALINLAKYNGTLINKRYAEAFILIKGLSQ